MEQKLKDVLLSTFEPIDEDVDAKRDIENLQVIPKMKPILFNTEMVMAILEGRKTVTRRSIKLDLGLADTDKNDKNYLYIPDEYGDYHHAKDLCKYQIGDILYVRETWNINPAFYFNENFKELPEKENKYIFKAGHPGFDGGWKPSIHMPKEAARIFLKVTGVRVERLQDITVADIEKEGYPNGIDFSTMPIAMQGIMFEWWANTWNSTVKEQDLDRYGLKANPWVWVIEFKLLEE